jgi:peptide/nickel transport system ATP-binding protein
MTAGDLLRIEDLGISFSVHGFEVRAVKSASLRVLPGKITALVGESGSGKSVIAQAVMGILPRPGRVTKGRILFDDPATPEGPIDLATLDPHCEDFRKIRGGRIGMIFQEPMTSLSPLHTIGEQIGEALRVHAEVSSEEEKRRTLEMLGLVGFPDPARAYEMYPFELSGGLRQRAMIAMALMCRPALLVADEPTTALDVTIQAQILNLLKDLRDKLQMSVLIITHDLGIVANIADEVVVIYHGEIMEAGSVEHIFNAPRHAYLKGLMAAVPHFDMKHGERLKALREIKVDAAAMLGGGVKTGDDTLLRVADLTKSFSSLASGWWGGAGQAFKAVDGVSFEIRHRECLGLVGESGCGKTTVGKLLLRALTPDAGSIVFDGADIASANGEALHRLRSRIQMVFQDPFSSLSPRMTVQGILTEPLEIHGRGTPESRRETAQTLMKAVGLDPRFLSRYPHSFSGGQRQRIGIARALALGPDLIVCDEPVSALDVSVQAQILNLLKDLQKGLGLTYLFVSHNLAVVDYMADRIAVMCRGRIVETAPREVLFKRPVHPYTKALLAAVPYPDLKRPLDYKVLNLGGASDENSWSPAFRLNGAAPAAIDLGNEHVVLAHQNADLRELRA